jgi:hypothetical protein
MSRVDQEIEILRTRYPDVEHQDPWVLLPAYPVPSVGWSVSAIAVAFLIPAGYPGEKPYAFHVSPPLRVGQAVPANSTESHEPVFTGEWQKFSWDCPEWTPGADPRGGTNLLHWALSFRERLQEYS